MAEYRNVTKQLTENHDELPPGKQLNLVLVGKTGQGKSDTGNTILEGNYFLADDSATSVTRVNKTTEKTIGGRVINVVDTPGCMDTEKGKQILDEIAAAVTEHPEGYDAVLIVLKYPLRMTTEEVNTIKQIEVLFGKEVYDYAVLVFTHGDAFQAKQRKSGSSMTFQEYAEKDLRSGDEHSLGPLVRNVKQRVVLFNNMELDDAKRRAMVIDLVKKIDGNGRRQRYDNHIFQKAREAEKQGCSKKEVEKAVSDHIEQEHSWCNIL